MAGAHDMCAGRSQIDENPMSQEDERVCSA